MQDLKLKLAAAVTAAGAILCLVGLAHAGPVPCDAQAYVMSKRVEPFAWASAPSAAAFAWATSKPHDCPCGDTCPCVDCQCGNPKDRALASKAEPNPRGLYWSLQLSGEYRLMEPGRCPLGMPCKDKQIGGWNGEYRPWDGYRWGPVTTPPIAPPVSLETAAAIITAGLMGLVSDDDICPGPNCPSCPQGRGISSVPVAFSGGGVSAQPSGTVTVAAHRHRRGIIRHILGAPFRAMRAMHARSAVVVPAPVESVQVVSGPPTLKTFAWQQTGEFELKPVTVPVTRFQWVPKELPTKK